MVDQSRSVVRQDWLRKTFDTALGRRTRTQVSCGTTIGRISIWDTNRGPDFELELTFIAEASRRLDGNRTLRSETLISKPSNDVWAESDVLSRNAAYGRGARHNYDHDCSSWASPTSAPVRAPYPPG